MARLGLMTRGLKVDERGILVLRGEVGGHRQRGRVPRYRGRLNRIQGWPLAWMGWCLCSSESCWGLGRCGLCRVLGDVSSYPWRNGNDHRRRLRGGGNRDPVICRTGDLLGAGTVYCFRRCVSSSG